MFTKALFELRNFYHKQKLEFEKWLGIFHFVAFALSLSITIYNIAKLNDINSSMFKIEVIKVIFELCITLYFVLAFFLKALSSSFLDPMKDFFQTLYSLKKNEIVYQEFKDFSIKSLIEPEQIPLVQKIAFEAWGPENFFSPNRQSLYNKWYRTNPNVFSLVFANDDPIGYICILPLVQGGHFNNEINVFSIDGNLIEQYPNSAEFIFIYGIFLKKDYQKDKIIVAQLYYEILKKITFFGTTKYTTIYSGSKYASSKKYFKKIGFGNSKKVKGYEPFKYLSFENYMPLDDTRYPHHYDGNDCNYSLAQDFLKLLNRVNSELNASKNRLPADQIFSFWNNHTIGQFFDEKFGLSRQEEIFNNFVGKTFKFYTHAVYSKDNLKEHSLGISIIKFDTKKKTNFISCNFYTASKSRNKQYSYQGICFFSNDCKDIIMIFHPEYLQTEEYKWIKYTRNGGETPVIITGRILKEQEDNILANNEGLLSLNITTYSQHTQTTISKIGFLDLLDEPYFELSPKNMFLSLQTNNTDLPLLKKVKSLLLRTNKVVIKGLEKVVINNVSDIGNWFSEKYSVLEIS